MKIYVVYEDGLPNAIVMLTLSEEKAQAFCEGNSSRWYEERPLDEEIEICLREW